MQNWYRKNKYHAHKTECNGILFDSKHEAARYMVLNDRLQKGEISDLELQKRFELTPSIRAEYRGPDGKVMKGRVIERPSYYIADFVYKDSYGNTVVEDVKSPATRTPVYVLKRKLMLYKYGIQIREV